MKGLNGFSGASGLLVLSVFALIAAADSYLFTNTAQAVDGLIYKARTPQAANKIIQIKDALTGGGLQFNSSTPSIITFYIPVGITILNFTINLADPRFLCPAVGVENYLTCLALNTDCQCTHGALGVHVAPRAGTLAPLQLMCLYSETDTTLYGVTPCDAHATCEPRLPTDNMALNNALKDFKAAFQMPFCEVLYNGIRNDEVVDATKPANATFDPRVSRDCTIDYGGLHNSYYPRLCSNDAEDQDGCPPGPYGNCYLEITGKPANSLSQTNSTNPTYFCTGLFNATADGACQASPPASPSS